MRILKVAARRNVIREITSRVIARRNAIRKTPERMPSERHQKECRQKDTRRNAVRTQSDHLTELTRRLLEEPKRRGGLG